MDELETLTAPQLRRLIDSGVSIAVVPFGSLEHQGAHLPLGADAVLADAVGREVAGQLGAVLAPTVRVGCAEQHEQLVGTMSLRAPTLTDVAVELAESLAGHGFTVIVLVSTHGGNRAALDAAVARLDASLNGAVACAPPGAVGPEPGRHSGQWLISVMLALRPDLVELDRASSELADELQAGDAQRGAGHIKRFVDRSSKLSERPRRKPNPGRAGMDARRASHGGSAYATDRCALTPCVAERVRSSP